MPKFTFTPNFNVILHSTKLNLECLKVIILRQYKFADQALAFKQNWSALESLLCCQIAVPVSSLSSLSLSLPIYEIYVIILKPVYVKQYNTWCMISTK